MSAKIGVYVFFAMARADGDFANITNKGPIRVLQLVYISTARQQPTPQELAAILDASRRNNPQADVTGLLLAGGRRFLQALEGPEAAVMATYARIAADPRHFAIVQLSCRLVEARQFGNWAMGFELGGAAGTQASLRSAVARLVAPLTDPALRAQFTGFAELHARAA